MDDRLGTIDDLMLRSAFMSACMAMAVTDPHRPDNPIVFTNPAFSQLTGYDAEEIIGRNCRFLQGPDTDPASVAAIRTALAARADLQIDILNYRRDGRRFVNRLYISPVLDGKGELIHFFASQLDASELIRDNAIKRRREDVLRYLAGELSQRLGSTLEVVQTLVTSTLTSASSVMEASEAISARLVALGQVHRRISDHDWEDEDFESLATQTLAPFRPQFASLQVEGPSVRLGALLSLKMASVIYELGSNATIRRACDARKVRLEWSVGGDRHARRLRLAWHEQEAIRLAHGVKAKVHRAISVIMNDPQADVSLHADGGGGALVCRIEALLPEPQTVGMFASI